MVVTEKNPADWVKGLNLLRQASHRSSESKWNISVLKHSNGVPFAQGTPSYEPRKKQAEPRKNETKFDVMLWTNPPLQSLPPAAVTKVVGLVTPDGLMGHEEVWAAGRKWAGRTILTLKDEEGVVTFLRAFSHAFIPLRGGDQLELFVSSKFIAQEAPLAKDVNIARSYYTFAPMLEPS